VGSRFPWRRAPGETGGLQLLLSAFPWFLNVVPGHSGKRRGDRSDDDSYGSDDESYGSEGDFSSFLSRRQVCGLNTVFVFVGYFFLYCKKTSFDQTSPPEV